MGVSGALALRELTKTTSKVLVSKRRSKVAGAAHFRVSKPACNNADSPSAHIKVRCEVRAEKGKVGVGIVLNLLQAPH
jgi:hypothetical protein